MDLFAFIIIMYLWNWIVWSWAYYIYDQKTSWWGGRSILEILVTGLFIWSGYFFFATEYAHEIGLKRIKDEKMQRDFDNPKGY